LHVTFQPFPNHKSYGPEFLKEEAKKKSPSTIKQKAASKQTFLEQKKISSETQFKCEQCDHDANCTLKNTTK
jgi:hypothetical protein